ncbi:hypothetical protein GGD83_004399 [Rhodoblastus sphagnicola]|nr:hypothetical protein [Rhodoblastus sphagnicola]
MVNHWMSRYNTLKMNQVYVGSVRCLSEEYAAIVASGRASAPGSDRHSDVAALTRSVYDFQILEAETNGG